MKKIGKYFLVWFVALVLSPLSVSLMGNNAQAAVGFNYVASQEEESAEKETPSYEHEEESESAEKTKEEKSSSEEGSTEEKSDWP